jgi:hypothetical protein
MPPRSRLENIELALKRSHSLPDYRPSVVTTAAKIRNDARLADIESALHPAKALNAVMAGRSICIHGGSSCHQPTVSNLAQALQTLLLTSSAACKPSTENRQTVLLSRRQRVLFICFPLRPWANDAIRVQYRRHSLA